MSADRKHRYIYRSADALSVGITYTLTCIAGCVVSLTLIASSRSVFLNVLCGAVFLVAMTLVAIRGFPCVIFREPGLTVRNFLTVHTVEWALVERFVMGDTLSEKMDWGLSDRNYQTFLLLRDGATIRCWGLLNRVGRAGRPRAMGRIAVLNAGVKYFQREVRGDQ